MTLSPELLSAVSAAGSAFAAIIALVIIWRAPIAAANYAERLKLLNERSVEIRRQKLYIFSELMKARGVQITRESVAALNLVDLVFKDSPRVRDAWAELYSGYNRFQTVPSTFIEERLTSLLRMMAQDLGFSEDLRSADFERYYYPEALAKEDRARSIQQTALIRQLEQTQVDKPPNYPPSLFPPKPRS